MVWLPDTMISSFVTSVTTNIRFHGLLRPTPWPSFLIGRHNAIEKRPKPWPSFTFYCGGRHQKQSGLPPEARYQSLVQWKPWPSEISHECLLATAGMKPIDTTFTAMFSSFRLQSVISSGNGEWWSYCWFLYYIFEACTILHAMCSELLCKNEQANVTTTDSCEASIYLFFFSSPDGSAYCSESRLCQFMRYLIQQRVRVDFSGQEDYIVTVSVRGNICREYLLFNLEQQRADDSEWYFPGVCGPAINSSTSVSSDEWVPPLLVSGQHVSYDELSCAAHNASYWSGNLVTSGQMQVTTACLTWQLFLTGSSPILIDVKSLVWIKKQYGILLYFFELAGAKLTHEFWNRWNHMENLQLVIPTQPSEQEAIKNGLQFQWYMALYLAQGLFFFDAPAMGSGLIVLLSMSNILADWHLYNQSILAIMHLFNSLKYYLLADNVRSRVLCMWQAHGVFHTSQLQWDNIALVFSSGLIHVGKLSRNWKSVCSRIGRRALKYMKYCWSTTTIWTGFVNIFNTEFSLQIDATCSVQPILLLAHAYQLSVLVPTVFSLAWGNLTCNSILGTTLCALQDASSTMLVFIVVFGGGQENLQGGRHIPGLDQHMVLLLPWDLGEEFNQNMWQTQVFYEFVSELALHFEKLPVDHGFNFYLVAVYPNSGYYLHSDRIRDRQLQWDPG